MDLLIYNELNPDRHAEAFARATAALRAGDFRAAQVKKLKPTPYYRAELSAADRLLFRFGTCNGRTCILLLEFIEHHAYDRSRFLAGAAVDESKLEPLDAAPPAADAAALPLAYLHPGRESFHLLDKVLSFDEEQQAAMGAPLPMILIGSAGSGKTVLLLERLKQLDGEVAYVTLSPFLAEHASRLYHAHGYERAGQSVDFLSFREYLESIRIPEGRPVTYRAFADWFARRRAGSPIKDAHQLFEEFSGVLAGAPTDRPWLSREEYLALGVRRSIFLDEQRPLVYDLFEKYREWLRESRLYDPSIETYHALPAIAPRYDAIVADEVQDLTNVQVLALLNALTEPSRFILSGDANQLVHPNFFSWSALKTMFYERRLGGAREIGRLLCANYRNAPCITDLANRILRLKNARFGSVDRESTMLARSVTAAAGEALLQPATAAALRDLDEKTRRSTRTAVIVLREEDKAAARAHFHTPLVFAIQEAKGLEYETVIVFDLVSSAARPFTDIAGGLSSDDLTDELRYARARDKTDKSLEALKFYVNALFVACTRAVRRLVLVESRTAHDLLPLLGLRPEEGAARAMTAETSSAEDWKREARKLELQGREEQAEAIRRTILAQEPVPWRVWTPDTLAELDKDALNPDHFNNQAKIALFDYAVTYSDQPRLRRLAALKFRRAEKWWDEIAGVERKLYADYLERGFPNLRRKLDRHGVNFRNALNQTPLMAAAYLGLPDLVEDLTKQGADPGLRDNFGRTAFHIALRRAFMDEAYLRSRLGPVYDLLAPESVNVQTDGRLHKIDRRRMEFFVLQTMMALLQDLLRRKIEYAVPGLQTGDVVGCLQHFPAQILPPHRRTRGALTAVMAGHELFGRSPRNMRLFLRLRRGYYVFNPDLQIAAGDDWVPVYDFIGLKAMADDAHSLLRYFMETLDDVRADYQEFRREAAATSPDAAGPGQSPS